MLRSIIGWGGPRRYRLRNVDGLGLRRIPPSSRTDLSSGSACQARERIGRLGDDDAVRLGGCKTEDVLNVGTVVIGVEDLHRAVAFWTRALNYVAKREIKGEDDFAILVPASGHGAHLALDVSQTPVQQYPRVHLDLYAGDAADQASEVERLVSLGATRVDWDRYPENPDFIVLADPEGNRFCVVDIN